MSRSPVTEKPLSPTAEAVLHAQAGGREVMESLLRRVQPRIYRFCCFLTGDPAASQDLAQEVYLKVLTRLDSLEDPRTFMRWVFTIARNLFLDGTRSRRERVSEDAGEAGRRSETCGGQGELAIELHQLVRRLSPEDRVLLALVHFDGNSYAAAAEICGTTEGAVKARLHKLRAFFHATLSRR